MKLSAIGALVVVTTFLVLLTTSVVGMKRICYFVNWAQYRKGNAKYTYKEIDPTLCSHIIIAFVTMEEDTNKLKAAEWNDDDTATSIGTYSHVTDLKRKNPNLKVMLAVGGWNFGVTKMSAMLVTKKHRAEFINDVVRFLRTRNFDGFDLDFEYPARRGSPPEDKQRFALLCKELREKFEDEAEKTSRPRLLLSAAVGCGKATMDAAYDVPELSKYLDWIGLMSYDLEYSSKMIAKHQSPLFPREDEPAPDKELCIEWIVDYWLSKGASADKLVVGMAFYGKSFKLKSAARHGVGAPKTGTGIQGPFTKQPGFLAYYEVCDRLSEGWKRKWIGSQMVPYVYNNTHWIGYDDVESMKEKAIWAVSKGLGGWMVWDLAMDDFGGHFCAQGKYPLLNALNENTPREDVTVNPPSSTTSRRQEKTTPKRRQFTTHQDKTTYRRRHDDTTDSHEDFEDDEDYKDNIDDKNDKNNIDDEDYDDYDYQRGAATAATPSFHTAAVLAIGVTAGILGRAL